MTAEKWALVPVTTCIDGTDYCRRNLSKGLPCEGCLHNGYRTLPDPYMVRVVTGPTGRPIAVDLDD